MIICGTGHRPDKLGGYTNEAFLKVVGVAQNHLEETKPEKVISGMAMGFDMALFQAALNLGISVVAAIPFKGQECKWQEKTQKYYHYLLSKASEIVYVCDPGYAAWKMQKRNEWMCDNADRIVACWDGSEGGTKNCVDYAERQGKMVDNIYKNVAL